VSLSESDCVSCKNANVFYRARERVKTGQHAKVTVCKRKNRKELAEREGFEPSVQVLARTTV
jgi:hypothetical protein